MLSPGKWGGLLRWRLIDAVVWKGEARTLHVNPWKTCLPRQAAWSDKLLRSGLGPDGFGINGDNRHNGSPGIVYNVGPYRDPDLGS